MTNDEKSDLRWYIHNKPNVSNEWLADFCGCTIATVKRYRKALAPKHD